MLGMLKQTSRCLNRRPPRSQPRTLCAPHRLRRTGNQSLKSGRVWMLTSQQARRALKRVHPSCRRLPPKPPRSSISCHTYRCLHACRYAAARSSVAISLHCVQCVCVAGLVDLVTLLVFARRPCRNEHHHAAAANVPSGGCCRLRCCWNHGRSVRLAVDDIV
jgi:hypothetical protein